jgi:transglutaminase-like putative cysteine protease
MQEDGREMQMHPKRFSGLILMLILVTIFAAAHADALPWATMSRPPEDIPWQSLGDLADVYLMHKGDHAVSVRSQPKSGAKPLYSWHRFAIRALDYTPEESWHKVALPGKDGFVQSKYTEVLPEEGRPRIRAYVETASLGYVYLAAAGEVPLVMDIQNGEKHHQLLMPNNGEWQPILLTLGAGKYKLSVYEAGLNDWPVRLLFEAFFEMESAPADTQLALLSSLHTNMDDNPETVALARSLCENATTDLEKVTLLWDWLMKHAAYDRKLKNSIQFSEIPDGDTFLRGERGICSDYAAFLAVGLRAVGVPTKHIYGKNLRTGNQHAWNEVYLDGRWQIIDATMAQSRGSKKFHTEDAKHYGAEKGMWDGFH